MSYSPEVEQPGLPSHDHDDYVRALEVIAEVSGILVEETARTLDAKVIEDAEAATLESAPRLIEQAEGITYETGVRLPRAIIGQADWFTLSTAPERAIEEAATITYKNRAPTPDELVAEMEKALKEAAVIERPRRPNDLELEDLVPGIMLAVYDNMPQGGPRLAGHEMIVSWPYEKQDAKGAKKPTVIKARKVEDPSNYEAPADPAADVREVYLEAWGITPNSYGIYRQNRFVEPYGSQADNQAELVHADSGQENAQHPGA